MTTKSIFIFISYIFFIIFFNVSNLYSQEYKFSVMNFYIGQPYWDVYENVKKITKDNRLPDRVNFDIGGINAIFDRNLNLLRVVIPSSVFTGMQYISLGLNVDDAKNLANDILQPLGKNNIKINKYNNLEVYEYIQGDTKFSFKLTIKSKDNAEIGPFILEKVIPLTGPIVKKMQLGMSVYECKYISASNKESAFLNDPIRILQNHSVNYVEVMPYSTFLLDLGFKPSSFGFERVDDNFMKEFIKAYNINGRFIEYDKFCLDNGITSNCEVFLPGTLSNHDNKITVLDGNEYYVFFVRGELSNGSGDMVLLVYKEAIPFSAPKIPPYNRPNFD